MARCTGATSVTARSSAELAAGFNPYGNLYCIRYCMLMLKFFVPRVVACSTVPGVCTPGSGVDAVRFGPRSDRR